MFEHPKFELDHARLDLAHSATVGGVWVQSFEDHHIDKSIGLRCNVVFTIKLTGPACYTKFVCSAMRMVRAASLGNEVDI